MRTAVCILVLAATATTAQADAPAARKLNTDGMKLYNKKSYSAALAMFDKAIAADPDFVLAHYNAASMASLEDDNARVVKELEWLTASKDPGAAKALAQGKTDADLARAQLHPRVRELLGLPALDKVPLAELALAYTGVWGEDGSACGSPALTMTFKKGGAVTVATEWGCDATDDHKSDTGKWVVTDGHLTIQSKMFFRTVKPVTLAPCGERETALCLTVTADSDVLSATFSLHRGAGELR